jgi:hypothetical protein
MHVESEGPAYARTRAQGRGERGLLRAEHLISQRERRIGVAAEQCLAGLAPSLKLRIQRPLPLGLMDYPQRKFEVPSDGVRRQHRARPAGGPIHQQHLDRREALGGLLGSVSAACLWGPGTAM